MSAKFYLIGLCVFFQLFSTLANANTGGSVELVDGRLKIQFSVEKDNSKGSFQLRALLIGDGFKEENGFVRTGSDLAPLEIYNYLYDEGKYVFTIYLPVDDEKFFVSLNTKGFVSFNGLAAQKLFDVVKRHVPRNDISNLEQYKWSDHSYCDKTKAGPVKYRCWISR